MEGMLKHNVLMSRIVKNMHTEAHLMVHGSGTINCIKLNTA